MKKIQSLCTSKDLSFIDNSNIDESCLNRSKLHLNRRGSYFLANNFKKLVNSLWKWNPFPQICQSTHEHPTNSLAALKFLRVQNHNNVIFSYLNINSIRNKFDHLKLIIDEHVDILCVPETKIGNSSPTAQFSWPGYHKPYRLDISDRRVGLLVYIKSHLPSRRLTNYTMPKGIQIIPFELNLRKAEWMFMCIYRPPAQNKHHFLENLSMITDHYSSIYDNRIILGDVNMEPNSPILISFMRSLDLFNIVKSNPCFKGNGICTDLILTNRKYCFKHSSTFKTGLGDHHNLIYSMLKTKTLKKRKQNFINIVITKYLIVQLFTRIFKVD